jgi:hypothetical protein
MLLVFVSTRSPRSTPRCRRPAPPSSEPHERCRGADRPRTLSWPRAASVEAPGSGGRHGSPPCAARARVEEVEDLECDRQRGAPGQPDQLPRPMRVHDNLAGVPVRAGDGVDWFTRLVPSRAGATKRLSCVGRPGSCARSTEPSGRTSFLSRSKLWLPSLSLEEERTTNRALVCFYARQGRALNE